MQHVYELHGKFKPYVRMTQRSKHVDPAAQAYLASQGVLRSQFRNQMQLKGWEMLPGQTPLTISIHIFHREGFHNKDLSNQLKALEDAAQGVVFKNDCWVDELYCYREKAERDLVLMRVEEAT